MNHHEASLSELSFTTLWNPFYLLLSIAVIGIYFFYTAKGPSRYNVSTTQKVWFIIGIISFYVAKGTPVSAIGHHYSFTIHMVQMSLLYFIAPPLIMIGLPKALLKEILNIKFIARPFNVLTKPLFALVSFNILISLYHLPLIFDAVMANMLFHEIAHTVLMISSILMWWPVIDPLPNKNSLSDLQKVGYIFADGVLLTPACALIIFADELIYKTYMNAPQVFEALQPLDDQQAGGVIMKIAQEIIYGGILLYILVRWVRRERSHDQEEEMKIINEAKARLSMNEQ